MSRTSLSAEDIPHIALWQWENTQRTIADLSHAIEALLVEGKHPGEGVLIDAQLLARKWKVKGRPVLEGQDGERLTLLSALVVALERAPKTKELAETLSHFSSLHEVSHKPLRSGLIEYDFGGEGEAEWGKNLLGLSGVPYEPRCMDEILRGGVGERRTLPGTTSPISGQPILIDTLVDMRRLEALFGMNHNRFPPGLPFERMGRAIVYDWSAVVEIMRALLRRRNRTGPGRPRKLWLARRGVKKRVLSAIASRISLLGVDAQIAGAFLDVIERR